MASLNGYILLWVTAVYLAYGNFGVPDGVRADIFNISQSVATLAAV
jgi:hypothetical protein